VTINAPSFVGRASISTLTGERAERGTAHRADRSDERSAKTLLERRLFAVVLRDGEKVARLRCGGEGYKINLITTNNQP
jgi:hypothetical protein